LQPIKTQSLKSNDTTEFQDVLIFLTGGAEPIATVSEISVVMNKNRETIYGYRSGNYEPPISAVRSLHRWLVKEKGCHVISKYLNPCLQKGKANGKVQDDLWSIHEESTDLARHYDDAQNGDPMAKQRYFDVITSMKKEIKDLEAEGEQL
jgi:hypothetical protein